MRYFGLGRNNLRSHFVFRPRHAPEWLRAQFLPVVFLSNEEELTGKTFTTSLNTTNPNTYVEFIFIRTSPLKCLLRRCHHWKSEHLASSRRPQSKFPSTKFFLVRLCWCWAICNTHSNFLPQISYSHFSLVRTISGKEKILYYRELLVSEKFFKTRWIPLVLPSPVILGEKFFLLSRITGYSKKFLYNVGFHLWFYSLRRVSDLFWAKSIISFFFKFIHWFKICLTRIVLQLGANWGTLLQKEEGKNEERKKKRRAKTCFQLFFFAREKWRLLGEVSQTSGLTARSAAQTASPPKTSRVNVVFRGLRYNLTVRRS